MDCVEEEEVGGSVGLLVLLIRIVERVEDDVEPARVWEDVGVVIVGEMLPLS